MLLLYWTCLQNYVKLLTIQTMTFCDYMNHFDIYYHISVHDMTITLYSITCVNIYIDIISMNYGSSLSPWPQGQWPQEFPPWRWQAPGALPVGCWWWKVLGKYTSKNSRVCGGYMLYYMISMYIYIYVECTYINIYV